MISSLFILSCLSVLIVTAVTDNPSPAAPKFRNQAIPSTYEVSLHETCKLRCPVTGFPRPTVSWYKVHSPLTLTPSDDVRITKTTLTFTNIDTRDAGQYFCRASNKHGTVTKDFTIRVIEPQSDSPLADGDGKKRSARENEKFAPHFVNKDLESEQFERTTGNDVVFNCPSAVGNPVPEVKWLKDGEEPVTVNGKLDMKKDSLKLEELELEDSGIYQCVVSNDFGSVNYSFHLEVHNRFPHRPLFQANYPRNVTTHIGESARFECRFLSDLHPRVVWLRHIDDDNNNSDDDDPNVQPLETNASDPYVLVLSNVGLQDAGYYTCLAGNAIGVSYKSAYLTVLPAEAVGKKALLVMTQNSTWLLAGVSVFFVSACVCVVSMVFCRRRKKVKLVQPHVVVTKKIILEKDENSIIPFVKMGYSSNLVTDFDNVTTEFEIPLDEKFEFPRKNLMVGKCLGQGAFAEVKQAEAYGIHSASSITTPRTVAVKMLKDIHTDIDMQMLCSELEVLKCLQHPNILSLLGCCSQGGPLYVIVEYCENGNLRDFLRSRRHSTGYEQPISNQDIYQNTSTVTLKTLVNFAYQIARAMQYLEDKKVVHRDLAARNVLLTEDYCVKVADFGLTKSIFESDYYRRATQQGKLPVRWLALESLEDGIFTTASDVWSFGVTLYEIFTLGGTPYPDMPICIYESLLSFLKCGHRMQKPAQCPMDIYMLMRSCMLEEPAERPSFQDVCLTLDRILMNALERVYLDLNFPVLATPENSSSSDES